MAFSGKASFYDCVPKGLTLGSTRTPPGLPFALSHYFATSTPLSLLLQAGLVIFFP